MGKEPEIITPHEAHEAAGNGEIYLIDIRQPEEWTQTGVGEHAHAISMHLPGFGDKLMELIDSNKDAPIAVMCASGKRSAYLAEQLALAGFTNVKDVSEGMFGNEKTGGGWLRAALPVAPPE